MGPLSRFASDLGKSPRLCQIQFHMCALVPVVVYRGVAVCFNLHSHQVLVKDFVYGANTDLL